MPSLTIALKDILIDPDQPVDLTALPSEQATALIRQAYRFLSSAVDVAIQGNQVAISYPEPKAPRKGEVAQTFDRALRLAQKGDFRKAVQAFKLVLEAQPDHADARRNLGMTHLELGEKGRAKTYVVEALRLDPRDAWAYVLLGNIYMRHEKRLDKAEEYYQRALELSPHDATLLTNYGALSLERGNRDRASEFFHRAMEADPHYPNAYYALALLQYQGTQPEQALATLDNLFAQARSRDTRSGPLYAEARRLYLEVNRKVSEATAPQMMAFVEERKNALAEQGPYPIRLVEDNTLSVTATAQTAWSHQRDYHIIKYTRRPGGVTPHLVAHEVEHIALEQEARQAGRHRTFVTTAGSIAVAMQAIRDQAERVKRAGLPAAAANQFINQIVTGLCNQLLNTPLDMFIEQRLSQRYDPLHPSQFVSLYALAQEVLPVLTDSQIRRMTPAKIYRSNVALNCAYALFMDSLYNGRTDYVEPYLKHEVFELGQRLFGYWKEAARNFHPGDEYALVDQYAKVLRLEGWYEWIGGESSLVMPDIGPDHPEGATNPALLEQKEPATVMYCLDALKRFQPMSDPEVREIASEIALLGRSGLDYSSSERKYTLRSLRGERFSGLHLLCLMYVGFQRVDPSVDLELPFQEAYKTALTMFQSSNN